MPLIKPRAHRVRVLRHIARLQEPNREALFEYARFIQETPDYVLNQLIETTLAKDRDFLTWRTEQASLPPPPTRTHADADRAEPPAPGDATSPARPKDARR